MARTGTPLVYDFDDAIYLANVSEVNRALGWLKMPGRTRRVIERASVVIAGNGELAAWARQFNPRVEVIPTTIDTDRYRVVEREPADRPLCIGWSGSPTTIEYLELLSGVLRDVQAETGVRLRVIGDRNFTIPGASVDSSDWVEESELRDLAEIDIGLMPLPDTEWARGKCGLKALQYMALGIATVTSPVGVNREIAEGGAALLASTDAEWREALIRLTGDRALRVETGARGRRRVEERYSTRVNVDRYVEVLGAAAQAR
jgi:glycosyltransferase involved in cell wall biosynthesis